MSNIYTTEVFWSEEDGGYIAIAPDLPGCSAFGETRAEAAAEIENAIEAWLQAAEAVGNPIPRPTRKRTFEDHSGKLLVRMPKELHAELSEASKVQGVSLNQYVCFLLTQRHYATHAVMSLGKNMNWKAISIRKDSVNYDVFQLSTSIPQRKNISSTSSPVIHDIPLAAIGVTTNG